MALILQDACFAMWYCGDFFLDLFLLSFIDSVSAELNLMELICGQSRTLFHQL